MGQVTALLLAFVTLLAAAQPEPVRTFDEDRVDAPPVGFVFSGSAPTRADRWLVRRERDNRERDNNVLAHLGDPERRRGIPGDAEGRSGTPGDPGRRRGIALAILDRPALANMSVAASFKLTAGTGRGGFVWRYQDPQNYYFVGLDFDEADQEIGLFREFRGNRSRMGHEHDLELQPKDWHVLKVVHAQETIRVYLDGIKVFDVNDKTFRGAGAIGLWSGGEAVMFFDNLSLGDGTR